MRRKEPSRAHGIVADDAHARGPRTSRGGAGGCDGGDRPGAEECSDAVSTTSRRSRSSAMGSVGGEAVWPTQCIGPWLRVRPIPFSFALQQRSFVRSGRKGCWIHSPSCSSAHAYHSKKKENKSAPRLSLTTIHATKASIPLGHVV